MKTKKNRWSILKSILFCLFLHNTLYVIYVSSDTLQIHGKFLIVNSWSYNGHKVLVEGVDHLEVLVQEEGELSPLSREIKRQVIMVKTKSQKVWTHIGMFSRDEKSPSLPLKYIIPFFWQ